MTETEERLRAGLAAYARSIRPVERPSVDELLRGPSSGLSSRPGMAREYWAPRPAAVVEPATRGRPSRRALASVAVAILTLLSGGLVVALINDAQPEVATQPGDSVPSVWPLSESVSSDLLTTPESAADTYLTRAAGLGPEWRLAEVDERDRSAKVHFRYHPAGEQAVGPFSLFVHLTRVEDSWVVTGAETSDGGPSIAQAAAVDDEVDVRIDGIDQSPGGWEQLRAELIARNGEVIDHVELTEPVGRGLQISMHPDGQRPAAVRLVVQADEDADPATDGRTLTHASALVLPAGAKGQLVADLFPAAVPPTSYYDAWVDTVTHRADGHSDWEAAVTSALDATVDPLAGPLNPTFEDVILRPDDRQLGGRYTTTDGSSGAFELARLHPGDPWFVLSLQDDAIEVREVTCTETAVEVTLVLARDSELSVGRAPTGGDSMRAGEELRYELPFNSSVSGRTANLSLALTTVDDGSILRFHDAWSC